MIDVRDVYRTRCPKIIALSLAHGFAGEFAINSRQKLKRASLILDSGPAATRTRGLAASRVRCWKENTKIIRQDEGPRYRSFNANQLEWEVRE